MKYQDLPNDTRVWIYQANRQLSTSEIETIHKSGNTFIDQWTAHGAKLKAAFEVFHNQFVILFADEQQAKASGCSIDKSVHFIKGLEQDLDITLLDKNLVTYKDGDQIVTCTRSEFSELIAKGTVTDSTLVFNNLAANKLELMTNWQLPLKLSWHKELIR